MIAKLSMETNMEKEFIVLLINNMLNYITEVVQKRFQEKM